MTQDTLEWKPQGHPVRWAVGICLGVAVASLVAIYFGLGAPRMKVRPAVWDGGRELGSPVSLQVELTNQAHSDLTVVSAGEPVPGLAFDGYELTGRQDGSPDGTSRLAGGGGQLWLTLNYRITDCATVRGEGPAVPVRVRTALGLERTITAQQSLNELSTGGSWTMALIQRQCDITFEGEIDGVLGG